MLPVTWTGLFTSNSAVKEWCASTDVPPRTTNPPTNRNETRLRMCPLPLPDADLTTCRLYFPRRGTAAVGRSIRREVESMRIQWGRTLKNMAPAVVLAVGLAMLGQRPAETQGGPIPRTSWDKKPDLNGIWQALNTADWDLETHDGGPSPVFVTGVWGARLPGLSSRVVR